MSTLQSLDITRRSATTSPSPSVRESEEVAKLIDISKCIGCKACQAACYEWNDLRDEIGINVGVYDNPPDLTENTWTLMRFTEVEEDGKLEWLIRKDGCMHCADPGCLKACLAPGAIVQYSNGIVDFISENCIGCGYCVKGCPFNIPRISKKDQKALQMHLVLRPRVGRSRTGLRQSLPDPGDLVRDQERHGRVRPDPHYRSQ
jgi:formate dehydrogenase iron-sulfur subunit